MLDIRKYFQWTKITAVIYVGQVLEKWSRQRQVCLTSEFNKKGT